MLRIKVTDTISIDNKTISSESSAETLQSPQKGQLKNLIVADYRSFGFMHKEFNLSVLHYLSLKYAKSDIKFVGEPGYALELQNSTRGLRLNVSDANISTRHQLIYIERLETFIRSAVAVHRTLRLAANSNAKRIYVLGSDPFLLFFFRLLNYRGQLEIRHLFHGDISAHFLGWQPRNPVTRYFRFPRQMSIGAGKNSHFVFLEESILASVRSRLSSMLTPCMVFPHPTPRKELLHSGFPTRQTRKSPRIAFVGVARRDKGFDVIREIGRRLDSECVELQAIGVRGSEYTDIPLEGVSLGPFDTPITIEEYHRLIAEVDYVILPADPKIYAFVASASFLDAMLHSKPVLAISSEYLRSIESSYGAIGRLFDNWESLVESVVNWEAPSNDSYESWKANIARVRYSREPAELASSVDF
jgi:hypothetical protein